MSQKNNEKEEVKKENKENVNQKQNEKNGLDDNIEIAQQENFEQENAEQKTQKMHSVSNCVSNEEYIKLKYQFAEFINNHKEFETEFENYKKRTREEIKQAKEDGITKAVEAILPALDSFKKAKKIITDKSSISGINLIEKNILQELEKLGVKRITCVGEPFNAQIHNAVMLVEDKSTPAGTVVEEVEAGYTLNEKVIKFSQVIVSK